MVVDVRTGQGIVVPGDVRVVSLYPVVQNGHGHVPSGITHQPRWSHVHVPIADGVSYLQLVISQSADGGHEPSTTGQSRGGRGRADAAREGPAELVSVSSRIHRHSPIL